LWFPATENYERFVKAGVEDRVYPFSAEAHNLQYANNFFDAAILYYLLCVLNVTNVFAFDIFDESLKETKKASEFLGFLNSRKIVFPNNPLFPGFGLHTIIADKYGDAFILEEGIDTNIISKIMNDFIIMTNFPNGAFQELNYDKVYGCGADRYICAHKYISNNINSFGINEAFEVIKKLLKR
jgi:hypothetical protein